MNKTLVVVESPTKVKTIAKYLPKNFTVLATYGHVRDLVSKNGAVDPNNDFHMQYQVIARNQKHVTHIADALKTSSTLLLATDPDREGEAIAWSVYELMREQNILKNIEVKRVVFYEITKSAVNEALKSPREISMDLVEAQIARRGLDYLVGFNLSPLLWKKVRSGLSAGRVQSPALRLIVEREQEIEKFISQEYWTIQAHCETATQALFQANLTVYAGEKVQQFTITNAETAEQFKQQLLTLGRGQLVVTHIEKRQRKRHPAAPFTTSTLQQEAARKLGFTTKRTMIVAQQLYEGIDIGAEGAVGLITYMRTDSVNLAREAVADIRDYIIQRFGQDNCPDQPRGFKTKSKNAQEAHEAIRPTAIHRTPDEIKTKLTPEQYKLYNLIWKRTVACQMIHATIDTVSVTLECGHPDYQFRATGSVITNPGFITVYQEGLDDQQQDDDSKLLPPLQQGQTVQLQDVIPQQHFTEPPPRFSEASLVKALEEFGIGRPSTYVSIISTLLKREYVVLEKKRFMPTDIGRVVNKFLTEYFNKYVDYDFTAHLEDDLDAISRGEQQWQPVLAAFWDAFNQQIHTIDKTVQRKDVTEEQLAENCPVCSSPLCSKLGRNGRFIGCTGYPNCTYTRNLVTQDAQTEAAQETVEGRDCPKCQKPLIYRQGRYGKFIGCSDYPNCKHIEPLEKPEDTNVTCPECNKNSLTKRKSRYGTYFYACSGYPQCKYAINSPPIAEPCPECNWPITMLKITKRRGMERVCPQKTCQFSEIMEPTPEQ